MGVVLDELQQVLTGDVLAGADEHPLNLAVQHHRVGHEVEEAECLGRGLDAEEHRAVAGQGRGVDDGGLLGLDYVPLGCGRLP